MGAAYFFVQKKIPRNRRQPCNTKCERIIIGIEFCVMLRIIGPFDFFIFQNQLGTGFWTVFAENQLFAGLEEQAYISGNLIFELEQKLCGTKQHGDVGIVPAGMHDIWIFRSIGDSGFFTDRERIDIGTQENTAADAARM